jgi:hypothetical protein
LGGDIDMKKTFELDETEPQPNKPEKPKSPDYLDIRIEQMKPLEDRLGISIENVSTYLIESRSLMVSFELRVLNGGKLGSDIIVYAIAYDDSGKIRGRNHEIFLSRRLFAFSSGSIYFSGIHRDRIKRVLVYPELN